MGTFDLKIKKVLRELTPPLFVDLIKRFKVKGKTDPEWIYVPEGWDYIRTHPEVKGWNVRSILEIYKKKWPRFTELVGGTGPLGVAHESSMNTNSDVASHNVIMSFA